MLRNRILRAVARVWWLKIYSDSGAVPVPRDAPAVRSRAADPDRVLVLGNGAASGWGVLTHGLALGGLLATSLQRRTGRASDVDLLGDDVMNAGSAPAWIGDRALDGYDLVVVVLGMSDALRQTPVLRWRAEMELLLRGMLPRLAPGTEVLVAGIEPVVFAQPFRGLLGRLAQRHADRLNAATRGLVAETGRVAYVELPRVAVPFRATDSRPVYEAWADHLADAAGPLLARARTSSHRLPGATDAALAPSWAPRAGDGGLEGLQALVDAAKRELGADLAWVGLLEDDRQVIPVATAAGGPASVPWDLTFCQVTVAQNDTLVVPDAGADRRFAGNPFLDVLHLEAYAGHPLRDADGTAIGTFCIASIRPRDSIGADLPALERFARLAEQELGHRRRAEEAEPVA